MLVSSTGKLNLQIHYYPFPQIEWQQHQRKLAEELAEKVVKQVTIICSWTLYFDVDTVHMLGC